MDKDRHRKRPQGDIIGETLAIHRLAVEGARQNPEGRVAEVTDIIPVDFSVTSSPKKLAPPIKGNTIDMYMPRKRSKSGHLY